MIDGLPPATLAGAVIFIALGGWTLTAYLVRLFYTGKAYSRAAMDDVIHDRNEWRAESRIKDQQLMEKDKQLRHMSEVGETVRDIMRAVREVADRDGGGERS